MQGVIISPYLAMKILIGMLRRWYLYLNHCMMVLSSEDTWFSRATVPFSVEPILLELEGER